MMKIPPDVPPTEEDSTRDLFDFRLGNEGNIAASVDYSLSPLPQRMVLPLPAAETLASPMIAGSGTVSFIMEDAPTGAASTLPASNFDRTTCFVNRNSAKHGSSSWAGRRAPAPTTSISTATSTYENALSSMDAAARSFNVNVVSQRSSATLLSQGVLQTVPRQPPELLLNI